MMGIREGDGKVDHKRPDFEYIARDKHGCFVGIFSDYADAGTAKNAAGFIKDGCSLSRYPTPEAMKILKEEDMGCIVENRQMTLDAVLPQPTSVPGGLHLEGRVR